MAKQIIIKGTPVVAANEVLVADSNSKIPAVDGSLVTTMAGGNITGTIPTARLDSGTTANKVVVVGASGLPAVDGSLLTGIVSYTKSASDPTLSTNPATGVGTEWVNHTTGKQFICTDATAGANVWTCSGGGSGNVAPAFFPGESYGYIAGGIAGGHCTNVVQRITFANASNSSNVGTLTVARAIGGGASSRTHGYISGGDNNSTSPTNSGINVIEKFAFSASTTGSDIGDLSANKTSTSGVGSQTHGYIRGGRIGTDRNNVIERWPFASDTNSSDVGDIITAGSNHGFNGQNSKTHGYCAGGDGTGNNTRIQKHAFSASADATGVGTLAVTTTPGAGTSSTTNGYTSGSGDSAPATNHIQKFSFSSDGNAADIADLTVGRGNAGGLSN